MAPSLAMARELLRRAAFTVVVFALSGGGGGGGSGGSGTPPPTTYTIGGTVTGLSGTVLLMLNGFYALSVSAPGTFTFQTALRDGARYNVAVETQPATQRCAVASSTGTVNAANVTSIVVTCTTYSLGGTVSGLSAPGLVLTATVNANLFSDLSIPSGSTTFTFQASLRLDDFAFYLVSIKTQPAGETCTIVGSTGGMMTLTSVVCVACVPNAN
jgi:hypothetical protein